MKFPLLWPSLTVALLVATAAADDAVGHGVPLWFFTLLNLALLRSIALGRVAWFHAFLSVFFVLGCWLKIVVHHIFDYPYVEPAGNFSGTDEEWRDYYVFASLIGAALILSKAGFLALESRTSIQTRWTMIAAPLKAIDWSVLILAATVFYLLNSQFAFFVTGVDARLSLPFGLNAPLAFMALIGFAVVSSIYLSRDVAARRQLDSGSAMAVLLVSAIASVSMASRAAIVMQAVPMLIAASYVQSTTGSRAAGWRPFVLFIAFLSAVLVAVSIYRINVFSGSSTANTELVAFFALESALLVVDRWIGAEAIMVAVSEPTSSVALMLQLLQEDAARGNDAIYQALAGSKYEFLLGLTFLTLPGYFGIFGLSGSGAVVFLGVLLLTVAGMLYEKFIKWALFDQAISVALVSAAVANAVTQLSFPRLLGPFLFQMSALAVIIHVLINSQFVRTRPDRGSPPTGAPDKAKLP